MSEWISAIEASRRIKAAGLSEENLIEWASQGRIRARAKSSTSSLDDPPEKRLFPKKPPSDKKELSIHGSWPDIPNHYWAERQVEVLWGAGTYEATVEYWVDYYQGTERERIKLFDLTFSKVDLDTLLDVHPSKGTGARPPKERWQQQRLTQRQADALKFIDIALTHPPKDPLGRVAMHSEYLKWHADPKNKRTGKPLVRSTFGKWQDRYLDGWRVSDSLKLVHNS
jgi:hypothetical protein